MSEAEKSTGLYSEQHASHAGTVIWADADGKEFEITSFGPPSSYKWPDATVVAPVVRYVRKGREATDPWPWMMEKTAPRWRR